LCTFHKRNTVTALITKETFVESAEVMAFIGKNISAMHERSIFIDTIEYDIVLEPPNCISFSVKNGLHFVSHCYACADKTKNDSAHQKSRFHLHPPYNVGNERQV
jgi:hypothetical protein